MTFSSLQITPKTLQSTVVLSLALTLSACGGVPADKALQIDNDGNGLFSGSAGRNFPSAEIGSTISNVHCGGPVENLILRSLDGFTIFTGQCASGQGNIQGQNVAIERTPLVQQTVPQPNVLQTPATSHPVTPTTTDSENPGIMIVEIPVVVQ